MLVPLPKDLYSASLNKLESTFMQIQASALKFIIILFEISLNSVSRTGTLNNLYRNLTIYMDQIWYKRCLMQQLG